ncbi:calcium-binding protein [Pannonibacter sp. SL95]|uniref:calcium-binding protein n=1 Tax=Pannonibacter sp. SL95 TaxID=2995153 RepID=UPI002273A100|nr:calcium-binding protein [Pannonibacter sp. SL95]MCY1707287.1 calcium-binding protein [Pannonibacter sp. SL95]
MQGTVIVEGFSSPTLRVTRDDIRKKLIQQASTAGNDDLVGFNTADELRGAFGDDRLAGKGGNDTYLYSRGDGNDLIVEGKFEGELDQLLFSDIFETSVVVVRNGLDLHLQILAPSSTSQVDATITLIGDRAGAWAPSIEKISFASGVVWSTSDIIANISYIGGTSSNDTIVGTTGDDADIRAGYGDDLLRGLAGSDTYIYRRGDGNDTIDEDSGGSDLDILHLVDLRKEEVTFERPGGGSQDVIMRIFPTGNSITLKNQMRLAGGVEKIVFMDGQVLGGGEGQLDALLNTIAAIRGSSSNDTLSGTAGDDVIIGGLGDDRLNGAAGSDVYIYASGDGHDYIDDESGSTTEIDVLRLTDLNAADVTFSRVGNHVKILVNGTGQTITLDEQLHSDTANWGIDRIEFAGGAVWGRDEIKAAAWLRGTDGADTLHGTKGSDVIIGGLGDDRLNGAAGSDVYIYASGDGHDYIDDESGSTTEIDVLRLTDLNAADVTFSRVGSHVKILVNGTGHTITLDEQLYSETENWGIDRIEFAGGTVWGRDEIKAAAAWLRGTNGVDTLHGTTGSDVIIGRLGDDRLNGAAGSDVYIYASGDGHDYIDDNTGSTVDVDVLRFTDLDMPDLTFSRVGTHVKILVNGTGHTITLDEQLYSETANWGIDRIEFAAGTVWGRDQIKAAAWLRGTSGADTLHGTTGSDVIFGGLGDDRLYGAAGSDVYIYASGDGNDYIDDNTGSTVDVDVLRFSDLDAPDLTFSRVGKHVKILVNSTGHTITLDEQLYSETANWGIDRIEFAGGAVWGRMEISSASWI